MSNHDHNRLSLLALKLRAGLTLSPEDQAQWDSGASLQHKVDAGLPLTEAEREQWERIRNIRMSVRSGGVLVVEDGGAPQTIDDWRKIVAKSRGTPVKLTSDLPQKTSLKRRCVVRALIQKIEQTNLTVEHQMNTTTPYADLAERLVNSDLIAPRTQRAIIMAIQSAGGERVTPAQFTAAAKSCKAKLRVVGAACGWARCEHCGQWRDIGAEPSEDLSDCACCLELQDDETFAGFALFHYSGGEVCASIALPASVRERMERYRQTTGGAS